jgi:hypothetical protein
MYGTTNGELHGSGGMDARADYEFADRYINREQARHRFGPLADEYARYQLRGDPLADALVESFAKQGPEARGHFERWLETDRLPEGASQALVEFAEAVRTPPPWVDFRKMKLGALTCQRLGPAQMLILSAWSLINGYHSAAAVKPLSFTGRLDRSAYRRLAETGRFVTEVSQTDGMRRLSDGFKTTVRVRVLHAQVRRMLSLSPDWDLKAWGVPINQGDMAGTVIEFSLLLLAGAREMGFRFTHEESEAVVHLWRYVGHLSGVEPGLLEEFETEERGMRFAYLVKLVQPGPDQDSLDLANALRRVPGEAAMRIGGGRPADVRMARFMERYHDGLAWAFNGEAIATNLEIPNPGWRYAIYPTRAIVGTMERVRRLLPSGTSLAAKLGNAAIRKRVKEMLEGAEPDFEAKREPKSAA